MSTNPVEMPVLQPVADRFSPYLFQDRDVADEDLLRCFEAARWAPSSFNDQPWSWVVAKRTDADEFDRMLGVLEDANQGWAKHAPVLVLTVMRTKFRYNDSPNRVALHDLGAASALLTLQATELGIGVHQMAGVKRSAAATVYGVPEHHEVQTAMAIGYAQTESTDPSQKPLREREKNRASATIARPAVILGAMGQTRTAGVVMQK